MDRRGVGGELYGTFGCSLRPADRLGSVAICQRVEEKPAEQAPGDRIVVERWSDRVTGGRESLANERPQCLVHLVGGTGAIEVPAEVPLAPHRPGVERQRLLG